MKQHIAHVATWEASLLGLLRRQSRAAAMGVPEELWAAHDLEPINAFIAAAAASEPLETVLGRFHATHGQVLAELRKLTDADFQRPYSEFDAGGSHPDDPIVGWIEGNTSHHYEEHIGWLRAGLAH